MLKLIGIRHEPGAVFPRAYASETAFGVDHMDDDRMNEARLDTIEQIREFLAGTADVV